MGRAEGEVAQVVLGRLDPEPRSAAGARLPPPRGLPDKDLRQGRRLQRALLRQAPQAHRSQGSRMDTHSLQCLPDNMKLLSDGIPLH